MTLTSGVRLGTFEITTAIGAGGMGEVYRAKDTKLGRDVAIKVLPGTFAQDPERLARFEREARLLASLNHQSIAHVYGFESAVLGDGAKVHFLAMEMVEGQDLAERLKNGPVPVDEALTIARQIAEGLEEAHEHGIIHRDLKPANVKVTPDGKVKILDFGLAKAYEGDPSGSAKHPEISHSPTMSRHMTEAGMILGTAAYMSPEQARGRTLDRRTDIWAFGVVLYEMLTGTRLFAGETVSDVLAAVLTREPDWKALPEATPASVRQLLTRCLDRDPKKRLRDIGEAALLLANPGPSRTGTEPAYAVRKGGRERAAWALATLALVLAAGLAIRGRSGAEASGPLYFSLSTALSESPPATAVISPEGTRVAFLGRLPGAAANTIFVRELREPTVKSLAGTEGVSSVPAFSPDGKWVVYISHNRGLKKVAVDGGIPVDLAEGNFRYATPAWLENGRIVITVFNWEQPGLLHEVPESGGAPTPLPGRKEFAAEAATRPRPLPGGRALLVSTGRDQTTLSVQSLETGERKALVQNARHARFVGGSIVWVENDKLMAAPFDLRSLEFSGPPVALPDGGLFKRGPLAGFDVSANGSLLFLQDARPIPPAAVAALLADERTGPVRRLVWIDRSGKRTPGPPTDPVRATEPRLSPDDAQVIVDGSSGQSGSDVWTIDLLRGTVLRLSFTDGEDETGVWSPDGAWVAWAASRTGQGRALYRRRSDGSGKEEKLWDSGGLHCHAAAWTPDGKGILMTVDSPKTGFDVVLVTLDPQPVAKPLLTDPFNETSVRISPDARWIAYASDESGRSEVYARAFPDLGSKIQISLTGGQEPVWSPDGGEIVYRSVTSREFMGVKVEGKGALAVAPPRVLASDLGLSRGDLDHTHYAVARDGRILTVQATPSDAKVELGFVLGWAQSAGLIK